MLIVPNIPFIPRRKRRSTPPAALVLTAASYVEDTSVTLTFDRAIDIASLNAAAVVVSDGGLSGHKYQGSGAGVLIDPRTVQIDLSNVGRSTGPDVELVVSDDNGIVASDDASAWGGVDGVELPFP